MLEAQVGIGVREAIDSRDVAENTMGTMTMIRWFGGFAAQKQVQGSPGNALQIWAIICLLYRSLGSGMDVWRQGKFPHGWITKGIGCLGLLSLIY
jgi:hypothetical protein